MKIDLFVDLNTEDETGLPWTYLDQASDPSIVVPGRLIVVRPLPGPVSPQRSTDASQRA
jgi:hypothetical protein